MFHILLIKKKTFQFVIKSVLVKQTNKKKQAMKTSSLKKKKEMLTLIKIILLTGSTKLYCVSLKQKS